MLWDPKRWHAPGTKIESDEAIRDRAIARHLRASAKYIEDHGWTQGRSWDISTGRVCVQGAMDCTKDTLPEGIGWWDTCRELENHIQHPNYLNRSVPAWNDDPRTTKAIVIKKLRSVARKLYGRAKDQAGI